MYHAIVTRIVHPLPSNGWKPGDGTMMARIEGRFQARMKGTRAIGWLGDADQPSPTLWPKGYGVAFNPTELVGPDGATVAREDDVITSAGGMRGGHLHVQGGVSLCRDVRHAGRHAIPPDDVER